MTYFRDLRVWQDSVRLAKEIYIITQQNPFAKDFGLSNQIQRAAVSISSNIAEGDERRTVKDSVQFFYIAKGSAAEVITQLIIAREIGYISEDTFKELEDLCEKIKASIRNHIKSRNSNF